MKNIWVRWSGLALLDDDAQSVYVSRLGEALHRSIEAKKTTRPKADLASRDTPTAPSVPAKPRPQAKIFSSRPSLRELMADYNKRTARLAPIKPSGSQQPLRQSFEMDPVDYIHLPSIPGRVLRPAN